MNLTSSPSEGLAALQKIIRERGEPLRYGLGQPLCESRFIPGQVLLIESGSARLLGEQGARLSTLTKLEAGELVGAASLLRGAPCEDVRAASELVARRISDEDFLDLVRHNDDVAANCRNHLWTAELAALLTSLLDKAPKQTRPLSSWLEDLLPQAHLLDPTDQDAIQSAFTAKRRLFVGGKPSEGGHAELGEELTNVDEISAL
ncbi:MAG: cyclic nucleotide-binding domain-containing protein, partial [Synechococcus sp. BS30m-G30]|nr:cyclic nucleotide-binding domain-containing protein [Synechococcus sp. BS30m-G30]